MKHNKSEIMKAAWANYRTGRYRNFSFALMHAWSDAKKVAIARENGLTTFGDIRVGDTITFEYGDYDNHVTFTVKYITEAALPGFYLFGFEAGHEICVRMIDIVKLVAKAAAEIAA